MITTLIPHLVIWAVLTTLVIFLAVYRKKVNSTVDETLHILEAEASIVPAQAAVAKKLGTIDLWGKTLTVVAFLYLLAIAGMYIYSVFSDQSVKMS